MVKNGFRGVFYSIGILEGVPSWHPIESLLNSYAVSDISLYDFTVLFNAEHDSVARFSLTRHNFKI